MKVACLWFEKPAPTSKIAELFLRFSPQICIRQDRAIFVEIGKCEKLYSEGSFRARTQLLLKRYSLSAQMACGRHITEALTLAKFRACSTDDLPLEALHDFADPFDRDPVLKKSLQSLILSFRDLGVFNIQDFRRLPAGELITRFGILGRHCHSRVHFQDFVNWPLWQPEEVIFEKKEFPYFEFYGELDPLLFELKTQLDSIFSRLFSRRHKLTQLQIQIRCEKVSTNLDFLRVFDFKFFAPQGSTKGTLRIVQERLQREFERNPIGSPIEAIQTKVLKSVPFEGGQKNFLNQDEEQFEEISSLHNQLVEMLGQENIYQAELTEDRRPERSWVKKFTSLHEIGAPSKDLTDLIPERATYLCKRPIAIEITAGFVHIQKRRYRILHWDPEVEKISGGWFEKPVPEIKDSFDRNYYQVEIEGHQRISVFETPGRQFFLHGYYG